jgi:hypothetical protein
MYSLCYAKGNQQTAVRKQRIGKLAWKIEIVKKRCFLLGPSRGYITRTTGQLRIIESLLRWQLDDGEEAESWQFSWALQGRLSRDDAIVELIIEGVHLRDIRWTGRTWARESEESPLLKSFTRKRLWKTLQAGEDLVFAAVLYKMWRFDVC